MGDFVGDLDGETVGETVGKPVGGLDDFIDDCFSILISKPLCCVSSLFSERRKQPKSERNRKQNQFLLR